MKKIDIETWDRKEHFQFFSRSDYAHYHIGANIDITHFRERIKAQEIPFSFAMTWMITVAMNAVEEFRYRMAGGEVILHDTLHPYFAYVAPNKKYFKMVLAELQADIQEFSAAARKKALAQDSYFIREDTLDRDDLIFISAIPNVSFTHLSHTITLSNRDDAVPRVSFGKYFQDREKLLMPVNVQAHHAFVDGEHMGQFFEVLQERLNGFS